MEFLSPQSQTSLCSAPCSVAQLCPMLCESMDHGPSSVHRIFQARILEGIVIYSSRGPSWPRDQSCISCDSCIGRQTLYHWATWEVPFYVEGTQLLRLICPFSILLCCLVLGFLIWIVNSGERLSGHAQICLLSSECMHFMRHFHIGNAFSCPQSPLRDAQFWHLAHIALLLYFMLKIRSHQL